MMRKSAFIYSKELEKYHYPPEHPFNTIRPRKVRELVESLGLLSGEGIREVPPKSATRVELKKFHTARYLHALKTASDNKWDSDALSMGIGTSDCPVFKGMYEYSVLVAGGTLVGAKLILSNEVDAAFNPSGGLHHAGPERASGFCYINDVALACMVFAEAGKKVLYLDVDVHYGDGVAYAFYDRSDVLTISFHENPRVLFPGTGFADEIGQGLGKGYCVNVPLPVGTYDDAYMEAFKAIALPLIGAFKPDVFVIQSGADALAGDPLAHLHLTNNVYADIIEHLLSFHKPVLMAGGGGYNIDNTVRAWALAWSVLCGADSSCPAVGGVMLQTTDWQGGLRDRTLVISSQQRESVEPAIQAVINAIKLKVFPIHGL